MRLALLLSLAFGLLVACRASRVTPTFTATIRPTMPLPTPSSTVSSPSPSLLPTSTSSPTLSKLPPTPTVSATPTRVPTASPTPASPFPHTTNWFKVLDNEYPTDERMAKLVEAFSTDVTAYLEKTITPTTSLESQQAALAQMATDLPSHGKKSGQVVPVDLDEAAQAELFIVPSLNMGPLLYMRYVDGRWQALPVPMVPPGQSKAVDNAVNIWPATAKTLDVTGDGQWEALITHTFSGGSNWREHLQVLRWNGASFDVLFRAELVNWAGSSTWDLEPNPDGSRVAHLTYPVFLPGRHPKAGINPQGEQFWRWDEEAGRFRLAWQVVRPPAMGPVELGQAEETFAEGDYAAATSLYEAFLANEIWQQEFLKDYASALPGVGQRELAAWLDLARLRWGLSLALGDRAEDARMALAGLETSGSLAKLAQAFLEAYDPTGDPLVGLAAYEHRLAVGPGDELISLEGIGELGHPAAVQYAFVPQPTLVLVALSQVGPEGLRVALEAIAAPVADLVVSDLDGDGVVEIVWLSPPAWRAYAPNEIPIGNWQQAWVAWNDGARWQVTGIAAADQIELLGLTPPDVQEQRGIQLYLIDSEQTRQLILFWDGETGRPWAPNQLLAWPVVGSSSF